ncbi:non-hydrolyzing UDP-N-acetylglucosamine 2-epimerase [Candidatus Pelagibacter sp. Uisw_134_02]|uniref:non-hydrolyzing UDP-N-acetylglucosamine 2-epimerase n=1 Tax=Candidatus Pelagibacter sp. Uisw_134_02 TaxID=3230990 RepID=UPI0039E8D85F
MTKKILIVLGTRPEAIKLSLLIKTLRCDKRFSVKVCITAQHREMLDDVLELFEIIPEYDLNIMKTGIGLNDITVKIISGLNDILEKFKPNIVLVQGDTTTVLTSALAAYNKQIPIAHVEAGLRTGQIYSPWPEEGNRKMTSTITRYHFAPTLSAQENLLKENIDPNIIYVTGNTVIDSLFWVQNKIQNDKELKRNLDSDFSYIDFNKRIILVTGHRRESFGEGFKRICEALSEIAKRNQDIQIIFPVHLNPNVQEPVNKILKSIKNIILLKPLNYIRFQYLISKSYIVLTDSGGIQEEAPSLGKPVLVMRDITERPEAIEAGTVKLVGTNIKKIVNSVNNLLDKKKEYQKMSLLHNPYGDGKACGRIVELLAN